MLAAKPSLAWRILLQRSRLPSLLLLLPLPPSSIYVPAGVCSVVSRRFLRQRPRTSLSPKELFSDIRRHGGNWRDVADERRRQRLRGTSNPHRRGGGIGSGSSGSSGKSVDEEDELGDAQLSTNRGDFVPVVEHYVKFSLQGRLQVGRENAARKDAATRRAENDDLGEEGPQVLVLGCTSPSLVENDFRRVEPRGKHIAAWKGLGVIDKIIPGRDPDSMAPLGYYFLLFRSRAHAHAYRAEALRLYALARKHTPRSLEGPLPPPPGFRDRGEDVFAALQAFTLISPQQRLSLPAVKLASTATTTTTTNQTPTTPTTTMTTNQSTTMTQTAQTSQTKTPTAAAAAGVAALIERGGYALLRLRNVRSAREAHLVLVHVTGYRVTTRALRTVLQFADDAVTRSLPWRWVRADAVTPLHQAVERADGAGARATSTASTSTTATHSSGAFTVGSSGRGGVGGNSAAGTGNGGGTGDDDDDDDDRGWGSWRVAGGDGSKAVVAAAAARGRRQRAALDEFGLACRSPAARRWIVTFADAADARRFVRTWHRRPFPFAGGFVPVEGAPMVHAELLW